MKADRWVWMPHAAHLIVGNQCRFHLATFVGKHIVWTVGEYLPDSTVREILADSRGIKLKGRGDAREADFLQKHGFETVGCDRKYESMVFPAKRSGDGCCPYTASDWGELDMRGYNDAGDAMRGHMEMCVKWAKESA